MIINLSVSGKRLGFATRLTQVVSVLKISVVLLNVSKLLTVTIFKAS